MTLKISSILNSKSWLGCLLIIPALLSLIFYSATLEDAQITFRYALRLSEGYSYGMWNRTGTPVEGATTLLWTLLLSLFGPKIEFIAHASKLIGLSAYLFLVSLFWLVGRKLTTEGTVKGDIVNEPQSLGRAFHYASIFIALSLPLAWYSTTGMETTLFISLIVSSFFLPLLTSNMLIILLVNSLLILVRPDGILFILASTIYYRFAFKERMYVFQLLAGVLFFIIIVSWRINYFGYVMPNTYYAKSPEGFIFHHFIYGLYYYFKFALAYPILVGVIAFTFFASIKNIYASRLNTETTTFLYLVTGVIVYSLMIARSGGDNSWAFPYHRHGLTLLPLIAVVFFYILEKKNVNTVVLILIMFTSVVIPINKPLRVDILNSVQTFPRFENNFMNNPFLLWLDNITSDETVIATSLAGALPLTVDAFHIDILGLNNEYIAHNGSFDPNGHVDSKTDMNYLVSLQPDFIEGYQHAQEILNGNCSIENSSRSQMLRDTYTNLEFVDNYLIVENAPYKYFNRILFIHKEHLRSLKGDIDIRTLPVDCLIQAVE